MERALILVVEDEEVVRDFLHCLLEGEGFSVVTAEDGATALNTLAHAQPRLMVTDVIMPRVSGLELIRHVRSSKALADLPILALTGYSDEQLRAAQAAGATAVMRKPFEVADFIATISLLISAGHQVTHG